jgi:hypothetical protein
MNRPREDWARLASYVVSARLAAGYRDRKELSAPTNVTTRTLGKLENGHPVSADTLAAVAAAVGWTPDSPHLVLSGREPRLVPQAETEPDGQEGRRFDSPLLQQIWDDPDLDDGLKEALITVAQAWRRHNRGGGGEERSA